MPTEAVGQASQRYQRPSFEVRKFMYFYSYQREYGLWTALQPTLPLLVAGQAPKHVTLKGSLAAIGTLVQLFVSNATHPSPPAEPAIGAAYIISASPRVLRGLCR